MRNDHPYNYFAFYHQNEGLLFQFFLHECIETFHLLKNSPDPELLEKLLGDTPHQWQCLQGHIVKMLHYYDLYRVNFPDRPQMKTIGQALERAYLAGQVCANLILLQTSEYKKPYQQIKREIKKAGILLIDLLQDYQENPHVLYFALCKHKKIDELYGKPIITHLMNTLFPGGLPEMKTFLCEKFEQKGFHHLLQNIQAQVEILSNE